MDCNVCATPSTPFGSARIMNRYDIEYFRCPDCGFIQTEKPYWLEEAYQDVIIDTDVGLVARNEKYATLTSLILRYLYPEVTRCVDYGGGYGMMTRMLRDRGHDFRHFDPYCDNLFAKGFEVSESDAKFETLTAFEVWEHMADPIAEIERMDSMADHWILSTHVVPDDCPKPGEWWYYALEGGQHVSLWTHEALSVVASRYNRHYIPLRDGLHIMSSKPIRLKSARWVTKQRHRTLLNAFRRREPLTPLDYQAAIERAA